MALKIIQGSGFYFPDSTGGTEVYITSLIKNLQQIDSATIQCIVGAPKIGYEEEQYEIDGIPVYRYPVHPNFTISEIRGMREPGGFTHFAEWLNQQKGTIYHQHSWTMGCNIHHLRHAKAIGMATVVTVHVPGNICLRGTMLQNGQTPCDGKIEQERCSVCWGKARGMSTGLAKGTAQIPLALSQIAASLYHSRLTSTLATRALVAMHQHQFQEMAMKADRIVAVCEWLYNTLALNGIPREKLVLNRQGVSHIPLSRSESKKSGNTLRIGFLGRWDRIKGIHVLVAALRRLPESIPVKLLIYGVVQGESGATYQQEVLKLAENDPRIQFEQALSREDVLPTITTLDLLAVPSQCLETGPIVVLEAHAVGVPVLGSCLGGIAELVQHGVNGWLVSAQDVEAWTQAITHLATHPEVLTRLKQGIGPVRTMHQAAVETLALYQEILN